MPNNIEAIRLLARDDVKQAEDQALDWLRAALPDLDIASVTLQPSLLSLNSFNGFMNLGNGERLFFKTHVDPNVIRVEYDNAQLLQNAGYNIVTPLRAAEYGGTQVNLYPIVELPPIADLARQADAGNDVIARQLLKADRADTERRLELYATSARTSTAEQAASAPIHQLFWHRVTGARLKDFYENTSITSPDGTPIPVQELLDYTWTINGVDQPRTLRELLTEAATMLNPEQDGLTITGHGDDHFANVFLQDDQQFCRFDLAFSGQHSALLDIVKPYCTDTLTQWMYVPQKIDNELDMDIQITPGKINLTYGPLFSAYRQQLFAQRNDVMLPRVLDWLQSQDALPHGRRPFDLASMCCSLLVMNLTDTKTFPPKVGWLGFAMSIQLGNGDIAQELRMDPQFALPTPVEQAVAL